MRLFALNLLNGQIVSRTLKATFRSKDDGSWGWDSNNVAVDIVYISFWCGRLLRTYPSNWQVYLAPDGQDPQLIANLVRC